MSFWMKKIEIAILDVVRVELYSQLYDRTRFKPEGLMTLILLLLQFISKL